MAVYLITYLERNNDKVKAAIMSKIKEPDRYQVQGEAGWLVSFSGTSKELFDLICKKENTDPPQYIGCVIITSASPCFGYGRTDMWEWLKIRSENTYVPQK